MFNTPMFLLPKDQSLVAQTFLYLEPDGNMEYSSDSEHSDMTTNIMSDKSGC